MLVLTLALARITLAHCRRACEGEGEGEGWGEGESEGGRVCARARVRIVRGGGW